MTWFMRKLTKNYRNIYICNEFVYRVLGGRWSVYILVLGHKFLGSVNVLSYSVNVLSYNMDGPSDKRVHDRRI